MTPKTIFMICGGIPVALWFGFWVCAFFVIEHWEQEYARRLAMIDNGEVQPEKLYVVEVKRESTAQNKHPDWLIGLGTDRTKVIQWVRSDSPSFAKGQQLEGYKFGEDYMIPGVNAGGYSRLKWIALAFGLFPVLVFGIIGAARKARAAWSACASPSNQTTS